MGGMWDIVQIYCVLLFVVAACSFGSLISQVHLQFFVCLPSGQYKIAKGCIAQSL
jgi:hypothetical protein